MSSMVATYVPLAFVLVVALTVHEWAHAWVAYKLGDDTAYNEGRVTFNPLMHLDPMGTLCFIITQAFGWAKPVPVNPSNLANPRRDDILITAAGPFSNFVLALVSALLYYGLIVNGVLSQHSTVPLEQLSVITLRMMIHINLILMMFNLLPLYPLDGSHIVTNLLPPEQAFEFKRFNEAYGPMMLLGILLLDSWSPIKVFTYILTPSIEFMRSSMMSLAALIF